MRLILLALPFFGFSAFAGTSEEVVFEDYSYNSQEFPDCDSALNAARIDVESNMGAASVNCSFTTDITFVEDPAVPPFGACVEIIGFSQTSQWATHVDAIDINQRTFGGAGIDNVWADPNSFRWFQGISTRACQDNEVTDIVLNVSSRSITGAADFEHYARLAVQNALDGRRPSLQNVFLQPVVGPPEGQVCSRGTRAQNNFPNIIAAINIVAGEFGNVYAVHNPRISDCADYTDGAGHLTTSGGQFVADEFEDAYNLN